MRNALPPASPLRAKRPKHLHDQLSWHNRVSARPVNGISTDSPFFFTPTTHSPPGTKNPALPPHHPRTEGNHWAVSRSLGAQNPGSGFSILIERIFLIKSIGCDTRSVLSRWWKQTLKFATECRPRAYGRRPPWGKSEFNGRRLHSKGIR